MDKRKVLSKFKSDPKNFLENMTVYELKYGSRQGYGCCPLHSESNPSFSINLETGLWTCFSSCGSGDLFSLFKKINNFDGNFYSLLQEMARI